MFVLDWLLKRLKGCGQTILACIILAIVISILSVVFFGIKLLFPVILFVAGLLVIFIALSDDSNGTSAASSNFLAAGIAYIVYTEFFDALLEFSKDDVGLAWIYLILISTLASYILKFGVMLVYEFYIARREGREPMWKTGRR